MRDRSSSQEITPDGYRSSGHNPVPEPFVPGLDPELDLTRMGVCFHDAGELPDLRTV